MRKRTKLLPAAALILAFLMGGVALAQTGGSYNLEWHTFDGGGGTASGGTYALSGTIGQPDAQVMTGGSCTLSGGFWGGATSDSTTYAPLVLRNSG